MTCHYNNIVYFHSNNGVIFLPAIKHIKEYNQIIRNLHLLWYHCCCWWFKGNNCRHQACVDLICAWLTLIMTPWNVCNVICKSTLTFVRRKPDILFYIKVKLCWQNKIHLRMPKLLIAFLCSFSFWLFERKLSSKCDILLGNEVIYCSNLNCKNVKYEIHFIFKVILLLDNMI